MSARLGLRLALALALLTTGCSAQPSTPTPPAPSPSAAETPPAGPPPTPRPASGQLVVWLPPAFAPQTEGAAGELLAARLAAFEQAHSGLRVAVRVKALAGRSGLLESLSAASEAAPEALPDLILLPQDALHTAALKGQIAPLDDLLPALDPREWHAFARLAAQADGPLFSMPIGAEVDLFAFGTDPFAAPPAAWADLLAGPSLFIFAAGDPTASFTLAQYLALGGTLSGPDGRPALDVERLTEVFGFYHAARSNGALPMSARLIRTAAEAWPSVRDGQAQAGTAPLREFLLERDPALVSGGALPTRDGQGTAFADVWSWAMVARAPERQAAVAGLMAWLSAPEFLGPWTRALSLLPPTSAALAQWPSGADAVVVGRLVAVARPRPAAEVRAIFGPPLRQVTEAVLLGELTPEAAAQAAAQAVRPP